MYNKIYVVNKLGAEWFGSNNNISLNKGKIKMFNFNYKRIYLCIEDNKYYNSSLNIYYPINGFLCKKFEKYEDAIGLIS